MKSRMCLNCPAKCAQDGTGLCRTCQRKTGEWRSERERGDERIAAENRALNALRQRPQQSREQRRVISDHGTDYEIVWDGTQ